MPSNRLEHDHASGLMLHLGHCSGDVGLGLNVRRMRNEFLSLFTVTYSLRPLGETASVFRQYPGQWQVSGPDHHLEEATRSPCRFQNGACLLFPHVVVWEAVPRSHVSA